MELAWLAEVAGLVGLLELTGAVLELEDNVLEMLGVPEDVLNVT